MKIGIKTSSYEWSHGRKPKGFGGWAFTFEGGTNPTEYFWWTANYGDAKKAAIAEAKKRGAHTVVVGA